VPNRESLPAVPVTVFMVISGLGCSLLWIQGDVSA